MTNRKTTHSLPGLSAARRFLTGESLGATLQCALPGVPVTPLPGKGPDGDPDAPGDGAWLDAAEGQAAPDDRPRPDAGRCLVALKILQLAAADKAAGGVANHLSRPGHIVRLLVGDEEEHACWTAAIKALWPATDGSLQIWEGSRPGAARTSLELSEQELRKHVRDGRSILILAIGDAGIPDEVRPLIDADLCPAPLTGAMVAAILTLSHVRAGGLSGTIRRAIPSDQALALLSSLELGLAFAQADPGAVVRRLSGFCQPRRDATGPTLDDVFGQPEAVGFFRQLQGDLEDWRAGTLEWDEVTASALLYGPPGTGKSLTPRAFANSAGLPLIATSYAACQKFGHQGDMLAALDRAVSEAIRRAPSVFFIDEIDAFHRRDGETGRNRSYNIGVVTGLLTQIDRLRRHPGVVVVAATNFPETVDSAVIRSGRLDRHIPIQPLDRAGIEAFLAARLGSGLSGEACFPEVADRLVGATGAEVEDFIRKARTLAREMRSPLSPEIVTRAADLHLPRTDATLLRRVALHEAGHLLVGVLLGCPRVNLIRVCADNGMVLSGHRSHHTPDTVAADLAMLFAGRAAERLVLGDPSSGAGAGPDSDLAQGCCQTKSNQSHQGQ